MPCFFPYISDDADEYVTFSRPEKTSVGLDEPSTVHKQEGTGDGETDV